MRPVPLSARVSGSPECRVSAAAVRWLALSAACCSAVLAAGAFVLFRTPLGLDMVGRIVARMVSEPGIRIEISGLGGNAPFDISAKRITLADAEGVWLAAEEVHLDLALGRLLGGRLHVGELTVATLEMYRVPDIPLGRREPEPWSERLRIPRLPMPITIDRFTIDRIVFAETVLGERIAATASRPGRIARRRGRNRAASAPYRRRGRRVRSVGSAKRGRAGSAAAACRARAERGAARASARSRRPAAALGVDRRGRPGIGLAWTGSKPRPGELANATADIALAARPRGHAVADRDGRGREAAAARTGRADRRQHAGRGARDDCARTARSRSMR